jgi:hypothetical protein
MIQNFIRDGDTSWRLVGYFTDKYEQHAQRLIESIKNFKFSASIVRSFDLGSWDKNTHYKSTFIMDRLDYHKEDIVYLDCDAIVCQYPSLFDSMACDVGCWRVPRPYGGHLSNGTIYLKNNENVGKFVKTWEDMCRVSQVDCFEQEKFERAVKSTGVSFQELPITYCQIYDFPIRPEGSVIVHNQASRQLRGRTHAR